MPKQFVNLDALIRREDFEVVAEPKATQSLDGADKLKIVELESDSLMYKWLRKPDFQRTTANWEPSKVAGFIQSFLTGDLIPALILWQSGDSGNIFVIDGAHRLSALIAWVHDDYGDRGISIPFFENNIPPEQKKMADETRRLIAANIGSYTEIKHQQNLPPDRARFASNVAASGITLQWVRGDASRAERSFHTINTEQTPISDLEVRMIRDRRCPNAIAARALVRAGTGQFSRLKFSEENKTQIRALAAQIYDDLFVPPLESPIKTLDLPVAGRSYSPDSVKMILDLIEFVNKRAAEPGDQSKGKRKPKPDILAPTMNEDLDGSVTVEFLRKTGRASSLIAGKQNRSLGLNPAVYFYSATGAYQPTAFLAAISFAQDLEMRKKLNIFSQHRNDFEELLLKYKYFINQIVRHYGSKNRSLTALIALFQHLFEATVQGKAEDDVVPTLVEDQRLNFLKPILGESGGTNKDFSTERKSAIYLREAIETATRCGICHARIHKGAITIDHKVRKVDGGGGDPDNGQLAHPYCNSGYKEWLASQAVANANQ